MGLARCQSGGNAQGQELQVRQDGARCALLARTQIEPTAVPWNGRFASVRGINIWPAVQSEGEEGVLRLTLREWQIAASPGAWG
jgi:hypothetical protein